MGGRESARLIGIAQPVGQLQANVARSGTVPGWQTIDGWRGAAGGLSRWAGTAAASPDTGGLMNRAEAELFGVLGELEATLTQPDGPDLRLPTQPWPIVCFPHPDPGWSGTTPPCSAAAAAALAVPGPVRNWRRRFHGLRAWRHLLPEAWRRDSLGDALFPLQPSGIVPAGRFWPHWCMDLQGAPAMTENISEQPRRAQKARPQARADPVFEGSTGSTPSPTRPARGAGLFRLDPAGCPPLARASLALTVSHGGTRALPWRS